MKLNLKSIKEKSFWEGTGVKLPDFNIEEMKERTKNNPIWVHFGSGNTYRGFISSLQNKLLNLGLADRGIIAAESFDYEIIDNIFLPFDNLSLQVTLEYDGEMDLEVIASTTEALRADRDIKRLEEIFSNKSLQFASFTITEKGYYTRTSDGKLTTLAEKDMKNGPGQTVHIMGIASSLLYKRFKAGAFPIAMLSLDNYPKNGEKFFSNVLEISEAWLKAGLVEKEFIHYLKNEELVSFPWTMIDKITPRPDNSVLSNLKTKGMEDMDIFITDKETHISVFVNNERPQYLVIEDKFPNGRPPLEKAGVYMTERETVNKTERMKVATCLNPLHTAMAIYGCLLGYKKISEEMKDTEIVSLLKRLGYIEGLPVVSDPGIISPQEFIDEVINKRLPNPFMPDTPARIVSETSLKVAMRFGETIKNYIAMGKNLDTLISIPLSIAGWLRYLLEIDDSGNKIEISYEPLKEELQKKLEGIIWNSKDSYTGQLKTILSNTAIFGLDLTLTSLMERIENYFIAMLEGKGSVRALLKRELTE